MAQWTKIQLFFTLSLSSLMLFSASSFADDRKQMLLCEGILTEIDVNFRGKIARDERTKATIHHIEEFRHAQLTLPADPANTLVNGTSHDNIKVRAEVASRVDAILADADENINTVAANFTLGTQEVIRVLLSRGQLEDVKALESGEWTFRSVDFKVTDWVFTRLINSSHWPDGSEGSIEVVEPGLSEKVFGKIWGRVSDVMASLQSPDDRREATVRMDSMVIQDPVSKEPILIDVVRFHRNVPEYDSNSRGRRRRDLTREEELIEFMEENRAAGREVNIDRGQLRRWR